MSELTPEEIAEMRKMAQKAVELQTFIHPLGLLGRRLIPRALDELEQLRAQVAEYKIWHAGVNEDARILMAERDRLKAEVVTLKERTKVAERLCGGAFMAGTESQFIAQEKELERTKAALQSKTTLAEHSIDTVCNQDQIIAELKAEIERLKVVEEMVKRGYE